MDLSIGVDLYSTASQPAHYVIADITSWDDVSRMFQTAEKILASKLDLVFAYA